MSKTIPVIKLAFDKDWSVLTEGLKSGPHYEVYEFTTAVDVAQYLSENPAALVITSLAKKEDLIQLASLLKMHRKQNKNSAVKFAAVNFSYEKQIEKAVAKLGIQDLIDPTINTKGLRFKIDFWMKALNAQAKKLGVFEETKTINSAEKKTAEEKKTFDSGINWIEPMDCEDDIWLMSGEGDCKKVLSRWMLKLIGPSPYVGHWEEVSGKSSYWKWEFNGEHEIFSADVGTWYFQGEQRPDFIWKENRWIMSGQEFALVYKTPAKTYTRILLKDRVLSICRNSMYAETKEGAIKESFDKELIFKKEGSVINTNEEVDHESAELFGHLQGKGQTDKLKQGPLSGKTKGTNALNSDPLAMDVNAEGSSQGPLIGPAGDKAREGQLLDMENKQNKHKTYYEGHNPTDVYDAADFSHQANNHSSDGELSGKGATDKMNNYYGNERKETGSKKKKELALAFNDLEESNIHSLDHARSQKNRLELPDEIDPLLEEATESPKITSYIIQKGRRVECKLDDYFDQTIIFTTHDTELQKAGVEMDLNFNYMKKDTPLTFSGKVTSLDFDGEETYYIIVEISESSSASFGAYMELYQRRQRNVDYFLKKVKGF